MDTFGINRDEWATLKIKTLQYNVPGRFVTFFSFNENSLEQPSGHYNFIYNFDDSLVNNIPMLAKINFIPFKFWAKLNQLNQQGLVLTIPHHTGKLFGLVATT